MRCGAPPSSSRRHSRPVTTHAVAVRVGCFSSRARARAVWTGAGLCGERQGVGHGSARPGRAVRDAVRGATRLHGGAGHAVRTARRPHSLVVSPTRRSSRRPMDLLRGDRSDSRVRVLFVFDVFAFLFGWVRSGVVGREARRLAIAPSVLRVRAQIYISANANELN